MTDTKEPAALAALIERLESATWQDRELADDVLLTCGWKVREHNFGWGEREVVWTKFGAVEKYVDGEQPNPLASIDAALTLVPDGIRWVISNEGYDDGVWRQGLAGAYLYHPLLTPPRWVGYAAPPPLPFA
jgi:hypothetical protein